VNIKTFHPFLNLMKNREKTWVTHYDLQIFKMTNMKFEIIEHETNALLYSSKDNHRGNKVFKNVVDYLDDLEQKTSKKLVKPLRSSLWGVLTQKNKKFHRVKKSETFDIGEVHVESLQYSKDLTIVETVDKHNVFYSSWARCGVFLTGYCRLQMMKTLLKCANLDDIIYINCDGFTSTAKQEHLPISNKKGDFKLVKSGPCKVGKNIITFD
jgi:hypothetical protein